MENKFKFRLVLPEVKGMVSAVYSIGNTIDSRQYIGSSKHVRSRLSGYFHCLRNDTHHSFHLQNFVNKYGLEQLVPRIIELCDESNLVAREQYWIDDVINRKGRNELFNIAPVANSCQGVKHKPQTPEKKAQRKKSATAKWGKLMADARMHDASVLRQIIKRAEGRCECCDWMPCNEDESEYLGALSKAGTAYWGDASVHTRRVVCYDCWGYLTNATRRAERGAVSRTKSKAQ